MINFVQFCQQEKAPPIAVLRQSWLNVQKNVIIPNGLAVDSIVMPSIPDDASSIGSYVSKVSTLARGIFDPRVQQFNRTELSPTIVLSQGLHNTKIFKRAVKMELLTAGPVDAMVASALKVKPLVTDASAWVTLTGFSLAVGSAATVSTILGLFENDLALTLLSAATAVVGFAGLFFFFAKSCNLHKLYFPPTQ